MIVFKLKSLIKPGFEMWSFLFLSFSYFFSFFFFSAKPEGPAHGPWQVSLSEVPCRMHKSRYSKKRFHSLFCIFGVLGPFLPPPIKKN
jgi:hypothetical protein